MDAAEARLLAMGCAKINLQVRTSNREAIGFYEAIGFRSTHHEIAGRDRNHDGAVVAVGEIRCQSRRRQPARRLHEQRHEVKTN